jgi:hypothetical protein
MPHWCVNCTPLKEGNEVAAPHTLPSGRISVQDKPYFRQSRRPRPQSYCRWKSRPLSMCRQECRHNSACLRETSSFCLDATGVSPSTARGPRTASGRNCLWPVRLFHVPQCPGNQLCVLFGKCLRCAPRILASLRPPRPNTRRVRRDLAGTRTRLARGRLLNSLRNLARL